jgi:hypothetical protein
MNLACGTSPTPASSAQQSLAPSVTNPSAGRSSLPPFDDAIHRPLALSPMQWTRLYDDALSKQSHVDNEQLWRSPSHQRASPSAPGFRVESASYYDTVVGKLQLSSKEIAVLRSTGVVGVSHEQHHSMGSAYYAIYTSDLPVLITTDSILHAWHRSFDELLAQIETEVLVAQMRRILQQNLVSLKAWSLPEELAPTSREVQILLGTALALLHPKQEVDNSIDNVAKGQIRSILKEIKAEKVSETELHGTPRTIDFSQFKPRGHYNHSETLQAYFRAMMWLGRADTGLALAIFDEGKQQWKTQANAIKSASLVALLLRRSGTDTSLQTMDDFLRFVIGKSDNLAPQTWSHILHELGVNSPNDLLSHEVMTKLEQVILQNEESQQAIRSQHVSVPPWLKTEAHTPRIFHFFGQRFLPDSYILSRLVYDSIVHDGEKVERMLPSGLDVMAALGNDRALEYLSSELNEFPYSAHLLAARKTMEVLDGEEGKSSIYNQWLATLKSLSGVHQTPGEVPTVMRQAAWADKMLQTQLGSWAELRHDSVLYGKQSYTATPACEYPKGFVEPFPVFYRQMHDMATQLGYAVEAISSWPDANVEIDEPVRFLQQFAKHMAFLKRLAQMELKQVPFAAKDIDFLKKTIDIRGQGSGPPTYDGWYSQLFYRAAPADWKPEIADVHTYIDTAGKLHILHAATGDVNFIVVALDNGDDKTVYVGPIYRYYEFVEPVRLDDETWRNRLEENRNVPARPKWLDTWMPKGSPRNL